MTNRIILLTAAALAVSTAVSAQNTVEGILRQVEKNNITLRAASLEKDAGSYANKSEKALDDPEFEFNYLWGNEQGNRQDIRVSQSFDFGTISGLRSKQADGRNALLDEEYNASRQEILLDVKQDCIEYIFRKILCTELAAHLENATRLVEAWQRKVEEGGASVMEFNNVKLHYAEVKGKLLKAELEKKMIADELVRLNGGEALELEPLDISSMEWSSLFSLPEDFESFFDKAVQASPEMGYAKKLTEVSRNGLKLEKSSWVPGLSVGYMSEVSQPEAFRGLTFGINIPLWRNSSKVRQSRLEYSAAQAREEEASQSFRASLLSNYNQALGLKEIAEGYREMLDKADNRAFLLEAQKQGEISLIEYITESDLYFDNLEETLSAEKEYQQSLAELTAMFL